MSSEKEENDDLPKLLSELAKTSSLHGISKVITSQQIIIKILWLLLMLGKYIFFKQYALQNR
jgi:hypothetical protein